MKAVEGWIDIKIRDFFSSSMPGDWGTDGNPEDCIPVLRSTNFRNNGLIDYSDIAYRKVEEARLNKRRIGKGTILIEKSGGSPSQAAGRVVYCDCEFNGTASNFIEVIKVKDDFSSRYVAFLLYYLYQIGIVLKYQQQTTGIINFKLNEYSEEMVNCPASKPEQTKIAEILSTVDRAIEQTEALITKQQRIKTGLMQDLLTRGIDDHGNLRSEQTHQFKDSPLGRIPVEWGVEKWSQVNGKIQDGTHFSPKTDPSAEFKYITSKNIKFGFLDLSDVEYIGQKQHNEIYKRCDVSFGDVLLTKDGANTGNAAINCLSEEFSLLSSVALIRPFESRLTTMFLLQTILSETGQRLIKDSMSGLAITRITLEIINNFLIKVPPLQEQRRIGQGLAVQDGRIKSEAKKLAKLRSLKTALMQDLLTGKKRVTALLDDTEVATL